MYSDGNQKTVSELQREAQAIRRAIVREAMKLDELKKGTAKLQFFIDQLFLFFAPGVETEEDKRALVEMIVSKPAELYLGQLPLLPICTIIANGQLPGIQRIFSVSNPHVDDSALIYFIHVLNFCPQAAQIIYLDISDTPVTCYGLFKLIVALIERGKSFTLEARGIIDSEARASLPSQEEKKKMNASLSDPYFPRVEYALKAAADKAYLKIYV